MIGDIRAAIQAVLDAYGDGYQCARLLDAAIEMRHSSID